MKATIYDVAKETGLSIATVSRVINKTAKVKEETEKKVRQAMQKLNYEPSLLAKGLATNQTHILSLMLDPLFTKRSQSQYVIRFINGVLNTAAQNDYEVLVKNYSLHKGQREYPTLNTDGVIFISVPENESAIRELLESGASVVYAGMQQSFDTEGCNIYGGFHIYRRDMLDILFDRGYRNVVMIEAVPDSNRVEMWTQTLLAIQEAEHKYREAGFHCRIIEHTNYLETLPSLLREENRPDALFIYDIETYIELSELLSRQGLSVPEDIGVVGTSHSKRGGSEFSPQISCIYLDAFEMGKKTAELLIQFLQKEDTSQYEKYVPYRFIDRGSIPAR